MNETDLLIRFRKYMLSEKYLTIDKTMEFVNSEKFLGEQEEKERLKKYKVNFPVCRDTVFHWMLRAGAVATHEGGKQTYCKYTSNPPACDVQIFSDILLVVYRHR